ncbi:hypothetical protein HPP92_006215 [Vanilla planifolia]|uniref:Pectinesterase inhibitor domain-containing protein n=1 Tax=Vanilla planifolia TaxID=51239 RepID=A0A835VG47_VANPL|nr:hypothetical protein HPP92_006215 [Vanilla planifolia]
MEYPRLRLAVFFLLFLHQNLFSSAAESGVVEQTCAQAAAKGIDFDFCVKTLKKNSKSSTAGTRDLATIATKLAEKEFKHVWNAIKKLLHGKLTVPDKQALSVCFDVYEDGIDALKAAIKFIKSRSESDAITYLSASLTDVTTCDDAFEEVGRKSPIAKMNEEARNFSTLALAITSLL